MVQLDHHTINRIDRIRSLNGRCLPLEHRPGHRARCLLIAWAMVPRSLPTIGQLRIQGFE